MKAPRAELAWVKEYRAHNDRLAAAIDTLAHEWRPRERLATLFDVRAIVATCETKEAILAAIDEIIDATGYTSPESPAPKL